jgi:hypothetical protein
MIQLTVKEVLSTPQFGYTSYRPVSVTNGYNFSITAYEDQKTSQRANTY